MPTEVQLDNVRGVLNSWGEKIVTAMQNALPRSKDVEGSTETLRNTIRFTYTEKGFPINFQITLADYWKYIDAGRKPGSKFPPPDVIRQWIINKGLAVRDNGQTQSLHGSMPRKGLKARITKGQTLISSQERLLRSLTYLFSRKIAVKGIPAVPFVSSTLTDEAINELRQQLSTAFQQDIYVEVVNIANKYKK